MSSDNGDPLENTNLNALRKQYDFLEAQNANLVEAEQQRRLQTSSSYIENATNQLPPLSDLIKGAQASNLHIDEKYNNLLALLIHLSNHSMKAYKQVQNVVGEVDDKISSEFCYLARAETSIVYALLIRKCDIDFELALMDAITSTRHIINDCLDIIAIHALKCYKETINRYETINITPYFRDFDNIFPLITEALTLAGTTRFTRGTHRIEEYLKFIEDEKKLPLLINFCEIHPALLYNLSQIFQDRFEADKILALQNEALALQNEALERKRKEINNESDAQTRHRETIETTNANANKQRNTSIIIGILVAVIGLLGMWIKIIYDDASNVTESSSSLSHQTANY